MSATSYKDGQFSPASHFFSLTSSFIDVLCISWDFEKKEISGKFVDATVMLKTTRGRIPWMFVGTAKMLSHFLVLMRETLFLCFSKILEMSCFC